MTAKILIVEDVPFDSVPLQNDLRRQFPQIQIDVAESGMMAAVCMKKNEYDLVISDQDADKTTRFWLYCFMRQSFPTTPLVICTTDPDSFRGDTNDPPKAIILKDNLPLLFAEVEKARQ